jgi:protein-disulfide isomerase
MKRYAFLGYLLLLCLSCTREKQGGRVFAKIDGQPVYGDEVDAVIEQELYATLQRVYFLRRTATEELINQQLIEKEAKNRGIQPHELLNEAVNAKMDMASIEGYIKEQHLDSRGIPLLNNGYRLVDVHTTEGKLLAAEEYRKHLKEQLIATLRRKYKVDMLLEAPRPPKIAVNTAPFIRYHGNTSAAVSCVIVTDFECDNCRKNFPVYKQLYETYKDKVKFGFTNFSGGVTLAATAALAADRQGRFWEMHDAIFASAPAAPTDTAAYIQLAEKAGLRTDLFRLHLRDTALYNTIKTNIDFCRAQKLYATPTIIVNGTPVMDAFSKEALDKAISAALQDKQ